MDQQYWNMFLDFKIAEYYYQFYAISSKRWKTFVSAACTLASAACLIQWAQSGTCPFLWSTIIMISQLISVLQPFFPYEKRLSAARYIHSDVTKLCTEVESVWCTFTTATDESAFSGHITRFRNRYDAIEDRFANADTFPPKKHIHKKAEKYAAIYLGRYNK